MGVRAALKQIGLIVTVACGCMVAVLFLSYMIDVKQVQGLLVTEEQRALYRAQVQTSKATVAVTAVGLLAVSAVLTAFYVKLYVDAHAKELGALRALGYSDGQISVRFLWFGMSAFFGALIGVAAAYAIIVPFYKAMNETLPHIRVRLHIWLIAAVVALPTLFFGGIAVLFVRRSLRKPVVELLGGGEQTVKEQKDVDLPFLKFLSRTARKGKKALVFFTAFAAFCYSAMLQMAVSMFDLASNMSGYLIGGIGAVLAVTSMLLSVSSLCRAYAKPVSVMRAFGYSRAQCGRALFLWYRPFAYLGFAVGTGYAFGLLTFMISMFFSDGGIRYEFSVPAFLIALGTFAVLYELTLFLFTRTLGKDERRVFEDA